MKYQEQVYSVGDGGPPGLVAAPRRTRRLTVENLFPVVICLACLTIVAACLYAADVPAWSGRAGSLLVPSDGAVSYLADSPRPARVTSVETAVLGVVETAQSVEPGLSEAVLGALGANYGGRLWRTRSAPATGTGAATVAVYRTDHGIALIGQSDGNRLRSYVPALQLTAPDGRSAGRWSVRGTVTGEDGTAAYSGRYSGEFTSTPVSNDCVRVTGSVTTADRLGDHGEDSTRTWCPGRGVVAETVRVGGRQTQTQLTAAPEPGAVDLQPTRAGWPDPADWSARRVVPVLLGAGGGRSALPGEPSVLPPVATADGVQVRATQQASDLVGLRMRGNDLIATWRVHPGGTVIGLSASGDQIVVATSQRSLVSYGSDGRLLWRQDLGDVAVAAPLIIAGAKPGVAVLTGNGSLIMVAPATGEIRWRQRVGDVLGVQPTAAAGVIAVPTSPDGLVGLDQQTGRQLWQATPAVDELISAGNRFVVIEGHNVHSFDAASGAHLWRRVLPGSIRQVVALGSSLLVGGGNRTTLLSGNGVPQWVGPGYPVVSGDGDSWLGWRPGSVDIHSQPRSAARTLAVPVPAGSFDPKPLAGSNGAWIFGADWTSVRVGAAA